MRCIYCHNPDTWEAGCKKAREVTVDYLIEDALKYQSYYKASKGGVTASGGEPLLQKAFLVEYFKTLKESGIHTAIETSGFTAIDATTKEVLKYTDLVILDIKASEVLHKQVTGQPIDRVLEFAKYVRDKKIPMWIRFVLVPGINDNKEEFARMGEIVRQFDNVTKFDVVPFHQLGSHKWDALGAPYTLKNTKAATVKQAEIARKEILRGHPNPPPVSTTTAE